MKVVHLLCREYEAAEPYAGIVSIRNKLLEHSFIVVMDGDNFFGILTSKDIVKSPYTLAIDCLNVKPDVDYEQEIKSVLELMRESRNSILPVFKSGKFIGIVTETDIIDFLFEHQRQAEKERKHFEEQIRASLKEKEVLLGEIHHRVKNNMQVIISLLSLQSANIKDKKYADMFKESQNRIKSMCLIHEKLCQSRDFASIDFCEYVKSLITGLFITHGVDPDKIRLNMEIEDVSLGIENTIPCGLIINELVSNSLKYAFPQEREGEILIALCTINENEIKLTISDDGIGLPENLDIRNTESMGLQLVMILAEYQLKGKIEWNRTGGTKYHIKFKSYCLQNS